MSFVIVFLIDDPPRLVIDIFSFQWIRGTFIFKSRYCVTRPRSLLVRNVASRYDPWPHFFFLRSRRSTRILSALGERGAGKRKRRELSRGWIAFSKRLGVELDRKSADRFVSRAILSPRTSGRRNFCRSRRGEWFSIWDGGWKWFCGNEWFDAEVFPARRLYLRNWSKFDYI